MLVSKKDALIVPAGRYNIYYIIICTCSIHLKIIHKYLYQYQTVVF